MTVPSPGKRLPVLRFWLVVSLAISSTATRYWAARAFSNCCTRCEFEGMNKLQISASCFLTFEKADCTILTQLVGWLFDVTIYFPFPNSFLLSLLSSSYPLQIKYFPPPYRKYFPSLNTFLSSFSSSKMVSLFGYFPPFSSLPQKYFPSLNIFPLFLLLLKNIFHL